MHIFSSVFYIQMFVISILFVQIAKCEQPTARSAVAALSFPQQKSKKKRKIKLIFEFKMQNKKQFDCVWIFFFINQS